MERVSNIPLTSILIQNFAFFKKNHPFKLISSMQQCLEVLEIRCSGFGLFVTTNLNSTDIVMGYHRHFVTDSEESR